MAYPDYRTFRNPDPNVGTYNTQTHKLVRKAGRWKRVAVPLLLLFVAGFWLGYKYDTNRFKDTIFDKEKKIEKHLATIAQQNKIIDSLENVVSINLDKIDVLTKHVDQIDKEKEQALKEVDKYKKQDVDNYFNRAYGDSIANVSIQKQVVGDLVECDYIKRELGICNEKLSLFNKTTYTLQNQVDLSRANVDLSGHLWTDIETDLRKREGRINRYQAKRQKRALGNAVLGGAIGFIIGSQLAK